MLSGSPCAAEALTILELDNCPLLTDMTLNHLIGCHNLQRIELYDCQLITRAGIQRLRVCGCFLLLCIAYWGCLASRPIESFCNIIICYILLLELLIKICILWISYCYLLYAYFTLLTLFIYFTVMYFITRNSIYAIVRICSCPSDCLSVRGWYHRKTVEVRIMKFSPHGRL